MGNPMRTERGFSLLESMVAGGLVTILAVTLFPAFYSMIYKSAVSSFRITCNSLVRAKLQQYVSGAGALQANMAEVIPTGFDYAKFRYRWVPNNAGTGSVACVADPTNSTAPGFRENTTDTTVVANLSPTEASLPLNLKGFQLWVNLRLYNPRGATPAMECPGQDYQFGQIGDAIEVSVTGMIRTEPTTANGGRGGQMADPETENGKKALYGGLRDLNYKTTPTPNPELTCSVSQIIYPPKLPFRYWLGSDGRIRNFQPTAYLKNNVATDVGVQTQDPAASEAHFRSLWSSEPAGSTTSSPIAGIEGFAVSPDNKMVYVLKAGTLLRYEGCTDQTVTVSHLGVPRAFYGVPNCPPEPGTFWSVLTDSSFGGLQSIAADFGDLADPDDDIVYGLKSSGPVLEGGTEGRLLKFTPPTAAFATYKSAEAYDLQNMTRARAIMISHTYPKLVGTAPTLYVVDNTCYFGPGNSASNPTSYCVSIFNAADSTLLRSVTDLPLQVEGVSN